MAHITIDDVIAVERLSGFALSDEERQEYLIQFKQILDYLERLKTVDTSGIEPTYQVTKLKNVMREDELIDYGVSTAELLQNAPSTLGNQIKVRRVL